MTSEGRDARSRVQAEEEMVRQAARLIHLIGLDHDCLEPFSPKLIRLLIAEPGHELWGKRVASEAERITQHLPDEEQRPVDVCLTKARQLLRTWGDAEVYEALKDDGATVMDEWRGEAPAPPDMDRARLNKVLVRLREKQWLRRDGPGEYVYLPGPTPDRDHVKDVVLDDKEPRLLTDRIQTFLDESVDDDVPLHDRFAYVPRTGAPLAFNFREDLSLDEESLVEAVGELIALSMEILQIVHYNGEDVPQPFAVAALGVDHPAGHAWEDDDGAYQRFVKTARDAVSDARDKLEGPRGGIEGELHDPLPRDAVEGERARWMRERVEDD